MARTLRTPNNQIPSQRTSIYYSIIKGAPRISFPCYTYNQYCQFLEGQVTSSPAPVSSLRSHVTNSKDYCQLKTFGEFTRSKAKGKLLRRLLGWTNKSYTLPAVKKRPTTKAAEEEPIPRIRVLSPSFSVVGQKFEVPEKARPESKVIFSSGTQRGTLFSRMRYTLKKKSSDIAQLPPRKIVLTTTKRVLSMN